MKVLRPFLIVALSMTAPAALAVTGDQQTPIRISADACSTGAVARPQNCPPRDARAAATVAQRATVGGATKSRKIIRMPWMIGAFQ